MSTEYKMSEGTEAVKEAKAFLKKIKPDLIINRVPKKALELFKRLAEEEFEKDYGMALKWLLDFYFGFLGKGHERAEAMAVEALEEIAVLKAKPEDKEKKVIKFCDGREKVIK